VARHRLDRGGDAATRTNDVCLAAQINGSVPAGATAAHSERSSARSIITGCWHMLTTSELFREAGGDYFSRRDPERATRRLIRPRDRLGHRVTLEAAAA
jgi:hypothetical protein